MDKRRRLTLTGSVICTLNLALIHVSSSPADAQPRAADPVPVVVQAVAEPAVVSPGPSSVFDNVRFFVGLDGSKQPQDLGINANMGVRLAANLGVPVVRALGIGVQLGAALNLSDAAVHVLDQISTTSRRTQTFATVGLFQERAGFGWAFAYDHLREKYYDTFTLGQVRGELSTRVSRNDEVGAWFTHPLQDATAAAPGATVRLEPVGQLSGLVRHQWATGAKTTVWAGVAASHHNVVLVFPDNSSSRNVIVYGARLDLPLNERMSITGSGNFLTPTSTGTVDAYLGVTFSPRHRTGSTRSGFAPPLDVANNPEFPVDLRR